MIITPDADGAWANTAKSAFAITPNDAANLTTTTRGLYVGVTGNLKVDMLDGTTVTFNAITGGMFHPICVKKVHATGTTATGIVGIN